MKKRFFSSVPFIACLFLSHLAQGEARFGPEIEVMGRNHYTGVGCTAINSTFYIPIGAGIVAAVVDDTTMRAAGGLSAAALAACATRSLLSTDSTISERHLRQIEKSLESKIASGDATVDWIQEGLLSRKALRVRYRSGHSITFGQDSNTIEVKTPPMSAESFASQQDFIQREIFDRAKGAGLRPPRLDGPWNGGHIHIDIVRAFDGDPKKFKNFVLDFISHEELSGGALAKDGINARAFDFERYPETLKEFVKYLDDFSSHGRKLDEDVIADLFTRFPKLFSKSSALNIAQKYGTLEIRAMRSPENAQTLVDQVDLLDGRIRYTNSLGSLPIPTDAGRIPKSEWPRRYRQYVEEAGLDYNRFQRIVPARFRGAPELRSSSRPTLQATSRASGATAAELARLKCIKDALKLKIN